MDIKESSTACWRGLIGCNLNTTNIIISVWYNKPLFKTISLKHTRAIRVFSGGQEWDWVSTDSRPSENIMHYQYESNSRLFHRAQNVNRCTAHTRHLSTCFRVLVGAKLGMRGMEADLLEGVDGGRVSSEGQGKLQ